MRNVIFFLVLFLVLTKPTWGQVAILEELDPHTEIAGKFEVIIKQEWNYTTNYK